MTKEAGPSERWEQLPQDKRSLLEARLKRAAGLAGVDRIPRRPPGVPIPLSFAQEQLWFLQQLEPGGTAYNQTIALRLTGRLEHAVLERCLNEIIRRHEVLRTRIVAEEGRPFQEIQPQADIPLVVSDVLASPEAEREAAAVRHAWEDLRRPFDLALDLPLRARLVRLSDAEHLLFTTVHHIAFDGWSRTILKQELASLYAAFCAGKPSPLEEPGIQYADYACWQSSRIQDVHLDHLLGYWTGALSGAADILDLRTDYPRRKALTHSGARRFLHLPSDLSDRLRDFARRNGVTLQMVLLAVYAIVLHENSGQEDMIIGCPATTRDRVELEKLIGFFVNTLPLRIRLSAERTFEEILHQVRASSLAGLTHREVPLQKLAEALRPTRDLRRPTLFQVTFQMRNFPVFSGETPALQIEEARIEPVTAVYDLNLEGLETSEGLLCWLIYNSDLFDASTIDGLLARFREILEEILADPGARLADLARPGSATGRQQVTASRPPGSLDGLYEASNLSMTQLTMWTGQRLRPDSSLYHVAFSFSIDGAIDPERFRAAFRALVAGCDALRSVIEEKEGVPRWRVLPELGAEIACVDLSQGHDPDGAARRWIQERCHRPMDLSECLFDCALLRLSESRWVWYLDLHHLISDFTTMTVIFRRVQELYQAALEGSTGPSLVLPSFTQRVERERPERLADRGRRAEEYWERKLAGEAEPLCMYGSPPPGMSTRAGRVSLRLGRDRSLRLRELASQGASASGTANRRLLNLLSSVLFSYLYRVTGRRELTVAMPFHNRRSSEDKETVGLLMEVLPIRIEIDAGETFRGLERKTAMEISQALDHRPHALRNPIRRRAYEVELNYLPGAFRTFLGLPVAAEWIDTGETEDTLTLQVLDFAASGDLHLRFAFNAAVFSEEQQRLAVAHFERLLDACLTDPDQTIDLVDLLPPEERERVLVAFNRTETEYARELSVERLIADQAARTPNQIAVVDGERSLTYAQLDARAGGIARRLKALGVARDQIVGLCAGRSTDMLTGLLGILKAGGAYLPLDPEYPRTRLRFMLEETRARVVVADRRASASLPSLEHAPVWLDEPPTWTDDGAGLPENAEAGPENLAYVVFTSGSTGGPKAVAVEHRSLVNFGQWAVGEFGLGPSDRVLQFASLSWDTSVEEIFPCLLSGATLVLRPEPMLDSYAEFLRQCRSLSITVLTLPTAFWHGLTDAMSREGHKLPGSVRLVNIGGEAASARRLRDWRDHVRPDVRLVNTFGLTEATAVATMCDLSQGMLDGHEPSVPIGRPIANVQAYVLNRGLQPVPVGVEGELCLGGVGLARGYLNHPELTAERFVPNPFSDRLGARLLKTGDMVRCLPDGALVSLGRSDDQVKIRGFRIEPAEIEARLCQHPDVRAAAVVAQAAGGEREAQNAKQLVAYVVPASEATRLPEAGVLRSFLQEGLPEFMLPAAFVELEALPLTPSGKVDRRALPPPLLTRATRESTRSVPRDSLEMQLAAIWEATLGVRPIGMQDDFFSLGGDSLLAVRLFSAIERTAGIRAPLASLFEAPTIAGLARLIRDGDAAPHDSSLVAIQVGGSRPPLYCVHWMGGNVLVYRDLALHLGPDQPVYGLQAVGLDERRRPHTSIEDMAAHYVGEMLSLQPSGPYYVAGASLGGKVAFEMAQQLRARGEQVALVALFDTVGDVDLPAVPIGERVRLHTARLRDLSLGKQVAYLLSRIRFRARRAAVGFLIRLGWPLPPFLWNLKETTYRAAVNYRPRPYPGKVTLFRAREGRPVGKEDIFLGWDRVAGGGMEVHEIPGDHVSLMKEPGVRLLAEELKRCLSRGAEPR